MLLRLVLTALATCVASIAFAADPSESRPFGLERRIPWTTSRVIGSPEKPLPYRTVRAYPQLTLKQPLTFKVEPGTKNIWVVQHLGNWAGPGRVVRFPSRDDVTEKDSEQLLALDHIIYGLAFHPKFAENRYVYIGCNGPVTAKDKKSRVFRYTFDPATKQLDPKSQTLIIDWLSDGHNGADLAFGPDGFLYVTAGDGTSDSDGNVTGQTLDDLPGACLRIDVDRPDDGKQYSVPKDNPFVDLKNARPEIWAYGLRNPWRMTFDEKTGHLWIGNNGQDLWEQVYFVKKGDNFGWSVYEGDHPFQLERKLGPTPRVKPAADHHHSEARSLTGGVVYHGQRLPDLRGAYVYGDFSTGRVWGIKHDGSKVTWHQELVDTPMAITGFGIDTDGELIVIDHAGGFYHLEPTPPQTEPSKFPQKLSETGLFLSVHKHRVDPALVPYSVNAPLWSDGAYKERYIALPALSQIDFGTFRGWAFPEGAVLVKSFALETKANDPESRRWIETRLMTKQQNEWVGYTYRWNDEQTEATLVEKGGADQVFKIKQPDGSQKELAWHFPSRAECMVCHSRASNFVLGLSEMQMNKVHDYDGVKANQLAALAHIRVLRWNVGEHETAMRERYAKAKAFVWSPAKWTLDALSRQSSFGKAAERTIDKRSRSFEPVELKGSLWAIDRTWTKGVKPSLQAKLPTTSLMPRLPLEYRRLVDPYDKTQPLDARARSYLHSNCATCHVEAGGGNALMELEANTPREKLRLFDAKPQHHTFGIADAKLIAPGSPERSVLLERVRRRGPGQMPPLATMVADEEAVKMLTEWIKRSPHAPREDK
jgi:glucose/arabinose dehydrogenase